MEDLSEKEQIEEIRRWWGEYGAYVMGGIILGVGGLTGYNWYSASQYDKQLEASTQFMALTDHVVAGDAEEAEALAAGIAADYGDTIYAAQTGLAMARLYMEGNRDEDAANALRGVIAGSAGEELKNIARLRLARIYLYQEKAQEAVDLLEPIEDEAFAAPMGEVLGDAYAALGQYAEAEAAYQTVLTTPSAGQLVDESMVRWKLLDLPVAAAAADDSAPEEAE